MAKDEKEFENYSDTELFDEIARKQTRALEVIYDRYAARLNGLALKILQDVHTVEEVLQEIFLKIWQNPDRFNKSKGNPLNWMMALCRNRAIDKLRAKQRNIERTAKIDDRLLFLDKIWSTNDPWRTVSYNEIQKSVQQGLSQLPVEQSELIELAFFQGYSQSEISKLRDIPLGTVKTRIRLGMQKLRGFLEDVDD
ncbi:MAG: sigma-70 family RNA polymerase sigma factor [bacterium]